MSARSLRKIESAPWEDGEDDFRPSGVHPIARPVPLPEQPAAHASQRPTVPVPAPPRLPGALPAKDATRDIYSKIVTGTLASVSAVDPPPHAVPAAKKRKQPGARRITRDLFLSLGSLDQIPRRTALAADLRAASIDPRQAFVLTLVDGMTPIESIVDVCPLPMHQVLVILEHLLSLRLLTLD